MCRADVEDGAAGPLGVLLLDMAAALAGELGVGVEAVRIGPVDLGPGQV